MNERKNKKVQFSLSPTRLSQVDLAFPYTYTPSAILS